MHHEIPTSRYAILQISPRRYAIVKFTGHTLGFDAERKNHALGLAEAYSRTYDQAGAEAALERLERRDKNAWPGKGIPRLHVVTPAERAAEDHARALEQREDEVMPWEEPAPLADDVVRVANAVDESVTITGDGSGERLPDIGDDEGWEALEDKAEAAEAADAAQGGVTDPSWSGVRPLSDLERAAIFGTEPI